MLRDYPAIVSRRRFSAGASDGGAIGALPAAAARLEPARAVGPPARIFATAKPRQKNPEIEVAILGHDAFGHFSESALFYAEGGGRFLDHAVSESTGIRQH
eukprot:8768947-Pyramimonas_sp.AAC.1